MGGPPLHRNGWLEVMRRAPLAKTPDDDKQIDALLTSMLDGYCATVDIPANLLTPELLRLYPDAIVIATTRDSVAWHQSYCRMIAMTSPAWVHATVYWIPTLGGFRRIFLSFQRLFLWRFGHKDLLLTDLERHEEMLRQWVPAERLHWYNCRDGWEPLCKILNVPVPDQPFPRNNTKDEGARTFRTIITLGLSLWAIVIGVVSLLGYALWRIL